MAKGFIDLIVLLIFGLIISIVALITYNILGGVLTGFQAAGITTTEGIVQSQTAVGVWDAGFIFFILVMGIISIASALMIRTHPIFFVLDLIVLVIIGVLAPSFSNAYDAFATTMPATDAAFPAMGYIMRDASIFFLVIGCITAIVMYSKSREAI